MNDMLDFTPGEPLGQPEPHHARRRAGVVVAGVAAVALGAGAVAWAAESPSQNTAAAGYGLPGGYRGYGPGGYGPGGSGGAAPSGAPTGSAPTRTHTPHLDGTVSSVSGSTILITDFEGFTRTIKVTGTTTYQNSLTLAKIKAGSRIHAEGTVDADKTSLDAKTVGTAPTRPAGGWGHGGPGQGGPGRGAPGQGAPSKSAAPSASPSAAPTS